MHSLVEAVAADAALAHPLTRPFGLPISPLAAAFAEASVVLIVAVTWPESRARSRRRPDDEIASWSGALSRPQLVTRLVAVGLLALAVAAGRLGVDDELENLAPALVLGAAWPLLVLISVGIGPVWRWIDPWDGLARAMQRGSEDDVPDQVWGAAVLAVPWVWYLSAYQDPLGPRSVGAILAVYTIVTLAGCLAVGRRRWLASSEPFGIVLSWMATLPRGRLTDWRPPRGAEVLLGVLAGGVLFGAIRRSELWGGLGAAPAAQLLAALGVVVSCVAVAGLLIALRNVSHEATRSSVARAAVPAVAGIIVAVAMDRNRLFTSLQLLPELLGDPFGAGWDLLGRPTAGLDTAPLGFVGLLLAQLAAVLAGHLAGAVVLARSVPRGARDPAAVALALLAAGSVIALAAH